MRFSYAESMIDPSFYAPLARAAEEAGYHSMVIPDSICYPLHADSVYPYSPDGSREFLEGKPFVEPFSLIPFLGAVTSRIRFTTFVVKMPIRNPVLLAKQATSTAVLTGNRLVLGVGTSPWREDYDVLGVDWASRGRRMDESIAILRGLAAGGYFEHHGRWCRSRRFRPSRSRCSSGVTRMPPCTARPGSETAGCMAGETPPTCRDCLPGWAISEDSIPRRSGGQGGMGGWHPPMSKGGLGGIAPPESFKCM
jgi:alkanesulfonate monooxygenase SsuD/methylene tetrahydromethanopterin reductase-like flavin-dependent oxidoreductase (luciferase family)